MDTAAWLKARGGRQGDEGATDRASTLCEVVEFQQSHAPGDLQADLRRWLGEEFVTWVLACDQMPMSATQMEIALLLHQHCTMATSSHRSDMLLPGYMYIHSLLQYHPLAGTSVLNVLRMHSGGDLPALPLRSGDMLLDSLTDLLFDSFGELLLRADVIGPRVHSDFYSPHGKFVSDAIKLDKCLPFSAESEDLDHVDILRSTGSGGGMQLPFVGPSIIAAAWKMARLASEKAPTFHAVVNELSNIVDVTRRACCDQRVYITGLTSLTGVLLPPNKELEFGWGKIRPTRRSDHTLGIGSSLIEQRTVARLDDDTEVSITDAGDLVLETAVRYQVHLNHKFDLMNDVWPDSLSITDLQYRVTQAILGYMLSMDDSNTPVVLPVWQTFIDPLQPSSMGYNDPKMFKSRNPTQLTDEQCHNWQEWINHLDSVDIDKLGVAPHRLIRAFNERRDSSDALIDAVIAWEALFGARKEATLRVTGAIARLLGNTHSERSEIKRSAARIYQLRSNVVHGFPFDRREVNTAAKDAIAFALASLRVMVRDNPDLLRLTSGERSTHILME